ncbi:MAG: DUF418 domain-containing protein [Bacteroidales bacterium]|nr:DUF418 domain-containing protein [Bacteroidales bacterium]
MWEHPDHARTRHIFRIGCFIFYGYGFACYRILGTTYSVLIGLALVVGQYFFCRFWFKKHTSGPLEALWYKLTWINP